MGNLSENGTLTGIEKSNSLPEIEKYDIIYENDLQNEWTKEKLNNTHVWHIFMKFEPICVLFCRNPIETNLQLDIRDHCFQLSN